MGDLDSAIDELAAEDPTGMSTSALAADIVAIDRAVARLAGERARRIAVFDEAGGGAADGAVTTAAWLRQACRTGGEESRTQVRVSAQLRDLPGTAAALRAGEIGWGHAALLAPVLTQARAVLDVESAQELEATLLELARVESADWVATAVRRVRFELDAEGELARADRDFRRRWVSTAVTPEGLVHIRGVLDAEGGATLLAALNAHMPPPSPEDTRSRSQVRADALVEIAGGEQARGDVPAVAGPRPHLTLTADLGTLQRAIGTTADRVAWKDVVLGRRGAELSWTGPIPAETARRIACDATVTRLLLDPEGQPLHLGRRRRLVSPAQREVLAQRDGGCIFPRCDRPPEWCDAHHLTSWVDGGRTDIEELCLLCRFHHRFTHEGGWTVTRDHFGRYTVEPTGGPGGPARPGSTRRRTARAGPLLTARCSGAAREVGKDRAASGPAGLAELDPEVGEVVDVVDGRETLAAEQVGGQE
ncbi:MAG TPA: DUF222 domain-containing protein [Mycobacteriales bacterium]